MGPNVMRKRLGPLWEDVKRHLGWKPKYELFNPASVTPEDGAWLAGLIDGEGCFRIQKPSPNGGDGLSRSYSPTFCISFRTDDKPMLEQLCDIIKTDYHFHIDNHVSDNEKGGKSNPAFKFYVRDITTLAYHLIPILERYPLRSKKKYELPYFKLAVNLLMTKRLDNRSYLGYTDEERQTLDNIFHLLQEFKKYNSNHEEIIARYNLPNLLT